MNFDNILKRIEFEIDKLNINSLIVKNQLNYVNNILSRNNLDKVENINIEDIFILALILESNHLNYREIEEHVLKNRDLLLKENYSLLKGNKDIYDDKFCKINSKRLEGKIVDFNSLRILQDNNKNNNNNILEIIYTMISIEKAKQEVIKINNVKKANSSILKLERNENTLIGIPAIFYSIMSVLKEIINGSQKYSKFLKEGSNKIKNTISKYNKAKTILENLDVNKTTLTEVWIENILSLVDDDEIKRDILIEIGTYQKTKFNELYTEYNKLSENNKLEIIDIFKECDIDYNLISKSNQENVLIMDKDMLKKFLKLINKFSNKDYKVIDYLLTNSNYHVLEKINSMIKDGILTREFVLTNLNILSIKEETINNYFKLIDLIEYIKSESINPRLFITDQSIYLSDINTIKNNVKVLRQYNLLSSLKTTEIFELLKSNDLVNKIDMLLELGYEKDLENNLGLLNNDKNKIKSLYILKDMNLLPQDMDSLVMVLDNNSFIGQTDNIDNYIFNVVDYRIEKSKLNNLNNLNLDEETNSLSRTITVGDIKLSRNRVMRNKEMFKNCDLNDSEKEIYSYIYGSILNEDEYNEIVSNVKGKVKQII